jgi:hypothetical protein
MQSTCFQETFLRIYFLFMKMTTAADWENTVAEPPTDRIIIMCKHHVRTHNLTRRHYNFLVWNCFPKVVVCIRPMVCEKKSNSTFIFKLQVTYLVTLNAWGLRLLFYLYTNMRRSYVVEAQCYQPEGRCFESRSRHWFLSMHLILPAALSTGVYSASNRNEYQKK